MPRLLDGKEAKAVANYLLQGIKVDRLAARVRPNTLITREVGASCPISQTDADSDGTAAGFEFGVARRTDDYALKFEGFFKVERDGRLSLSV